LWTEQDGVRSCTAMPIPSWRQPRNDMYIEALSKTFDKLFKQLPTISQLYAQPNINDPTWLLHRCLELLPIHQQRFIEIMIEQDPDKALNFIEYSLLSPFLPTAKQL
jgi:hypothetical protein